MAKRTISAKEFAADVRSGMEDEELANKYQLSPEWIPMMLAKLVDSGVLTQAEVDRRTPPIDYAEFVDTSSFDELEATGDYQEFEKTIALGELDGIDDMDWEKAEAVEGEDSLQTMDEVEPSKAPKLARKTGLPSREIVSDVRSGLQDSELMEKYSVSEKTLGQVFTKLLDAGLLTTAELDARKEIPDESLLIETADLDEPSGTANISDFATKLPRPPQEIRQIQEIPGVETEAVRGGDITREIAESLREFSAWWKRNKAQLAHELPRERPKFHRKKLVKRSVELSMELVKAAEKKAAREKRMTGGDLDSLIELLLWDFLDRDPRFTG
jgi:DNA-binding Lrp family transcriptional regulator